MIENVKSTCQESVSIQELLEDAKPLPLVAPFVSGTPCVTPDGEQGTIVSDTLILEGEDGKGGTRKFIASYWQEAKLHANRGAKLGAESSLRVRSVDRIRRFHAGEIRIIVRRDLACNDDL